MRPKRRVRPGTTACSRNIATLAAMIDLSAVEMGPGPKENDEAYGEE